MYRFDDKGNLIEIVPSPKDSRSQHEYESTKGHSLQAIKWAQEISRDNLVEYSSHAEAVSAGKKPCKTCRA